jgi:hypothetical protein
MSRQEAQKKASAEYRREKPRVGGVRKKKHSPSKRRVGATKKKTASKRHAPTWSKGKTKTHRVGVPQHLEGAKTILQDEYGVLSTRLLDPGLTVIDRKRIRKRMVAIKMQLRQLSRIK